MGLHAQSRGDPCAIRRSKSENIVISWSSILLKKIRGVLALGARLSSQTARDRHRIDDRLDEGMEALDEVRHAGGIWRTQIT